MAAQASPFAPPVVATVATATSGYQDGHARSKESSTRRLRPNLTKICMKTKMCSFHVRGACKRGQACTFAHDASEVQVAPDLGCTKLCPELIMSGQCSRRDACKFAHSAAELRRLDVDEEDAPSMPNQRKSKVDKKAPPQVVSALSTAADAGFVCLQDMVSHLTSIFKAIYSARPDMEDTIGVTPDQLAAQTASLAWADAGLADDACMDFQLVAKWCIEKPVIEPVKADGKMGVDENLCYTREPSTDFDVQSVCSTEEGEAAETLDIGNTPTSDDAFEVTVQNTFIHVVDESFVEARRRSRSVPSSTRDRN